MRRQFFRFYLGVGVVLLAVAAILPFVLRHQFEVAIALRQDRSIAPLLTAIRFRTAQMTDPRRELRELIRELGPSHPDTVEILPNPESYLSAADMEQLSRGEAVHGTRSPEADTYALVGDGVVVRIRSQASPYPRPGTPLPAIVLVAMVLTGGTAFFLLRPIERRVLDLAEVATRFGRGDFSSRARIGRMGAVDQLETSFNWMADRIEQLLARQKELLRDVSHDLRTPLSRIFFALDDALSAQSPDEKDQHLARIDRGLNQLNDLVQGILTYRRLVDSTAPVQREPVALEPLLNSFAEMVADLRADLSLEIICSETTVFAEPRLFLSALSNLVTNAVAFSQKRIRFTCQAAPRGTLLTVEDDGPGISADIRGQIFEPFFHVDSRRADSHSGSGLGLAIVAKVMEGHGGQVTVSASELGGACFSLLFPSPDSGTFHTSKNKGSIERLTCEG